MRYFPSLILLARSVIDFVEQIDSEPTNYYGNAAEPE